VPNLTPGYGRLDFTTLVNEKEVSLTSMFSFYHAKTLIDNNIHKKSYWFLLTIIVQMDWKNIENS
jgi:hypothetical protein